MEKVDYDVDVYEDVLVKEDDKIKKGKVTVWNDDVNTFEYVANVVSEYCNISYQLALSHAFVIHDMGKSVVYRSQDFNELEYIKAMLMLNALTVTID